MRKDGHLKCYEVVRTCGRSFDRGLGQDFMGDFVSTVSDFEPMYNYGPCGEVWQNFGIYGTKSLEHARYLLSAVSKKMPQYKFAIVELEMTKSTSLIEKHVEEELPEMSEWPDGPDMEKVGWGLSNSSSEKPEIQRYDNGGAFGSDKAAARYALFLGYSGDKQALTCFEFCEKWGENYIKDQYADLRKELAHIKPRRR